MNNHTYLTHLLHQTGFHCANILCRTRTLDSKVPHYGDTAEASSPSSYRKRDHDSCTRYRIAFQEKIRDVQFVIK